MAGENRPSKAIALGILTVAILSVVLISGTKPTRAGELSRSLDAVHKSIMSRHAGVRHMSAEQLIAMKKGAEPRPLVLDVREADEFAVSRIPGALRVSPDIEVAEFIERFGGNMRGRPVVMYCSVGVRSSSLAERVTEHSRRSGATAVYNLTGGVFNWHNQTRPLVNSSGPTAYVHPYSWRWSRFVDRRALIRYKNENR